MYKKIMVPLDGSELAECVLPHVDALARGCDVADVVLVRVAEPSFVPTGAYSDGGMTVAAPDMVRIREEERQVVRQNAEQYLDRIVKSPSFANIRIRREVLEGPVAETLADYAEKNGVDLIVICTHGRTGVRRWVWGSVADRMLRAACVPVFMVRPPNCLPGV
jgi:nucleotide-binding universal stress UspA family protein